MAGKKSNPDTGKRAYIEVRLEHAKNVDSLQSAKVGDRFAFEVVEVKNKIVKLDFVKL